MSVLTAFTLLLFGHQALGFTPSHQPRSVKLLIQQRIASYSLNGVENDLQGKTMINNKMEDNSPFYEHPISNPIESRVPKKVNPFALTRVESEYLTSVTLQLGCYNTYLATANIVVDKLSPSDSLPSRLRQSARMSLRVNQIMAIVVYSGAKQVEVKENIETVTKSKSGERKLNQEALSIAIVERATYLVSEDLNNIREGIYPLPSELKLVNQIGPIVLPKTLKELYDGLNFAFQDTYVGNADYSAPNEPSADLKQLASDLDLPDYYLVDYHSVPAGFLSPKHPPVYDLISEAVFSGTHFMARRMTMRPLAEEMNI